MQRRMAVCLVVLMCLLFWGTAAPAVSHAKTGHGQAKDRGTGILLVAFGTSIPEAQAAFANIEKQVRTAFPDVPVRWAYTSSVIRNKLARKGQHLDSPEVALAKMKDEGFSRVAVQSLHMIPGWEFHDVQVNTNAFREMTGGFRKLLVGYPALSTPDDLSRAVEVILSIIPEERRKDEAVILMGHGTDHPSSAIYEAMMYRLQRRDPNIYLGTVAGTPELDDIREMLLQRKVKKAYLMPFMSVAGDHALNDLAGDEPDSWKSVLTGMGIECVTVLKGMAEYDEFADIWVGHLKDVMGGMAQTPDAASAVPHGVE